MFRLALMLAAALALAGCDGRTAGTETGNPEITVAAGISVTNYGATETLELNFRVMGMDYTIAPPGGAPDSGRCWARPGGTLVDFAGYDTAALPDTSIPDAGPWPQAGIILRTPEGPAGIPDTADIGTWSNPRYARFKDFVMGEKQLILFEMPQGAEYRLRFEDYSTEMWRDGEKIWIPFSFNATCLMQPLASFRGLRSRLDGKGASYLPLTPTDNVAAWNALNARMKDCFYADSVIVR